MLQKPSHFRKANKCRQIISALPRYKSICTTLFTLHVHSQRKRKHYGLLRNGVTDMWNVGRVYCVNGRVSKLAATTIF